MDNRITNLFGIEFPIIQAGMIWCSGWKLASAVSNGGGLGIIGAGSMYPEVLLEHITKFKIASKRPFAVNVPLLYPDIDKIIKVLLDEEVKIVFTSAGNPALYTQMLKDNDITTVHVVSSVKFAIKAEQAGVDAVVAEGFEAGGHNGKEETTSMCLIPSVYEAISVPLIAAGGIGSGRAMLAAFALGAEAVQIGSRFAASIESSAHKDYKQKVVDSMEGDTVLTLKQLAPVRLIKNRFYQEIEKAEFDGSSREELTNLLGNRRAKNGIFEGDLIQGELEIGQISSQISSIQPAGEILSQIWNEFLEERQSIMKMNL
jgi:enoyl-[acyl-carrier protein] reductase II